MSIQSERQLKNTERKLAEAERLYAEIMAGSAETPRIREFSLRSLKQTINELKEEIARYRAHASVAKDA